MAELKQSKMSVAEFLDWQVKQDRLYDLVDGLPRLSVKMMTGATQNHDRVTINAIVALHAGLRGSSCRPCTDDVAVQIPAGNIRRPDVLVECGDPQPKDLTADRPVLVMEVLSPGTMEFDRFRKLEEYKTVPDIMTILLVNTESPEITLHEREGGKWKMRVIKGLDSVIRFPDMNMKLALQDLYEGVVFSKM